MKRKPTRIHRFNIFYTLLKIYQLLVFHLFYKRVEVVGRVNIPYGSPIIFTPNHQNALMDALIVLDTAGLNPVFMARADIFKKKTQKKILTFLKMLPVYRMRDGAEELSRNDETFEICMDILKDRYSVCLMPEGSHGDKRRLKPFVKGTFRIAFKAQEEFGDKSPVKIVPVGLDFEDYTKICQDLLVIYGKPIDVSEYMDAYHENPPKAINNLKERLSLELRNIMIHIENVEFYDSLLALRTIYNSRMRHRSGITGSSLYERFLADKQMISMLEEYILTDYDKMKELSEKVEKYTKGLEESRFRNWVIDKKGYSFGGIVLRSLLLLLLVPVFIAGWTGNIIPYFLSSKMVRKVKDPQFLNSFRFAMALIIFLFYYLLVIIITGIFTGPAWIPWLTGMVLAVSGFASLRITFLAKRLYASLRFRMERKKSKSIQSLEALFEEITGIMNRITDSYMENMLTRQKKILHAEQ